MGPHEWPNTVQISNPFELGSRGEPVVMMNFPSTITPAQRSAIGEIFSVAREQGLRVEFDGINPKGDITSGTSPMDMARFLADEGGALKINPENTFGKFLRSDEGIGGPPQLTAIEGGKNLPVLQRPAPTGRDAQNYLKAAGDRDRMQARLAQSNKPTTDPETTWVFTDVEGSTDLIRQHGNDVMSQVMATQKKILTDVFTQEVYGRWVLLALPDAGTGSGGSSRSAEVPRGGALAAGHQPQGAHRYALRCGVSRKRSLWRGLHRGADPLRQPRYELGAGRRYRRVG
jgi:hypothetical protein